MIERMLYCKILQACSQRDLIKHSELFTRLPGTIVSKDMNLLGRYCLWCVTWRHVWLDLKSKVHTSDRRTIDWQSTPYRPRLPYIRLDSLTFTIKESLLFYSMQGKSSKPRIWSGDRTHVRAVGQQSCIYGPLSSHGDVGSSVDCVVSWSHIYSISPGSIPINLSCPISNKQVQKPPPQKRTFD